ncbi:MAG: AAA family ATPase [Planctomycetota bacterium]|nr:AAA family ATPase [Planctomycetota bacterium]
MSSLSAFDPPPSQYDPGAAAPGPEAAAPPPNPLLLLHRGLRGRYPLALAAGAVLAVLCAGAGYVAVKPAYRSTALIRVAPTQARIIYQTEDNGQMANWDSFVGAQVSFIQSRRVIQLALASDRLAGVGWAKDAAGEAMLAGGLQVNRGRGSEIITVSFDHPRPDVAQAAANAIVDAYNELKDETFGLEAGTQERVIQDRVRTLQNRLDGLREEENQLAGRFGVADIETHHRIKSEILSELERVGVELRQRLAQAELLARTAAPGASGAPGTSDPGAPAPAGDLPSDDQLAQTSPRIAELLQMKRAIEHEIRQRFNLQPDHRAMIALRENLVAVEEQLRAAREAVLREPPVVIGRNGVEAPISASALAEQVRLHDEAVTALREEVRAIGTTRQQIATLRERKEEVKRDLDIAQSRLTALEVERNNTRTGRITVLQMGDAPMRPQSDRRLPLAGAGGVAGLGLGVGIVWVLGFVRGGFRFADDIEHSAVSTPVLEILPHIDERDAQWVEMAAHRVHHIRSYLNSQRATPDTPLVVLVTSATAGDGKTYLTNALSHSFAISGHRTCVVDADLIGRQLSKRLGCVNVPGLSDAALADQTPSTTRVEELLDILPAGRRDDYQPEQLNRAYIERTIDDLRRKYNTIIIDTGPALGSLEANLLAPIADRVLLVISRGQQPALVRAAVSRIRILGGRIAGVVFNRATKKDHLSRSPTSNFASYSSVLSRSVRSAGGTPAITHSPLITSMRQSLNAIDRSNGGPG